MKKIYIYSLLLFTFTCCLQSFAQTPQYFKGAGTGSNSYPFSSTAGLKTQHLYLPGDLPGAVSGNITRIYFRSVTSNVSGTFTNFSFKLGQTTATQFPGSGLTFATPLTTVISGSPYTVFSATGTTDWFYVDLPTPFPFDANQSLILEVVWDAITTGGFNVRTSTGPAAPNNKRLTSSSPTAATGSASSNWMDFGIDVGTASACPAPTGLAATGITYTGANLSWNTVTGATGYEYAVTTSATPPASGTGTTATSYSTGTLTAGTTYYLHVRTNCGSSFSSWATINFTTTTCAAPSGLAATGITYSGANLSWNAITGVTGYEYAVTSNATPPASGTGTTATSYNASGLTVGSAYYLHVRTQCTAGVYSAWSTISFSTNSCNAPTGLTATAITANSASISWASALPVIGYEYSLTTSSTPPTTGTVTSLTALNQTGLAPATNYCIHVRSICATGIYSSWSTFCFNTNALPPCPSPTAPVITNITTATADVNWGTITGASGYEYDVSTNSAPPTSGTPTTATSYSANALTGNTAYFAHVRTDCGSGNFSAWVTTPFNTADTCLPPVATISNITDTTADINWGAMTSAIDYEYSVNTISVPPTSGTTTTNTSYSATLLTPNSTYYVHLRTHCLNDTSGWSTANFVTTNVTSVAYINGGDLSLEIHPNPTTDFITVTSGGAPDAHATISLTDMTGKTITTIPVVNRQTIIQMTMYSKGVYFLKYTDGEHAAVSRIMKD